MLSFLGGDFLPFYLMAFAVWIVNIIETIIWGIYVDKTVQKVGIKETE